LSNQEVNQEPELKHEEPNPETPEENKIPEHILRAAQELWPVCDGLCLRHGCVNAGEAVIVPIVMTTLSVVNSSPEIRIMVEENKEIANETTREVLDLLSTKSNYGVIDVVIMLNCLSTILKAMSKNSLKPEVPDTLPNFKQE